MQKEQFDHLSYEQKSLISVAYLLTKPELQPEETKRLFEKLAAYDKNANQIQSSINHARKTINELQPSFQQVLGSITAISSIIAELISEDKFEEYCMQYDLPGNESVSEKSIQTKPDNVLDFAGSTAKKLPDPETK
jgi:signal transduction histidine kinase